MTDAPHLTSDALRDELGQLYRGRRRHHLVAYYGTGAEGSVKVESAGDVQIQPVRSELDLRLRMPPLEDDQARVAFLLPWEGVVPLDLAGRFVDNGRVQRIGPARRLAALCGAPSVDSEAARSTIARYLLRLDNPRSRYPISAGRVTEEQLWATWLALDWGVETAGGLGRDTLLAWAAFDARGPRFVEAMQAPEADGLREALLAFLERSLGCVGTLIWKAWEQDRGRAAVELGVLCETLASSEDGAVRVWLDQRFKGDLGITESETVPQLVRALGQAAPLALRVLERRGEGAEAQAVVRAADARVDYADVAKALEGNHRLPSAWERRLARLGAALERGAKELTVEAVEAVAEALHRLEQHALFKEAAQTRVVKRAEMAARLLAWLVARPDRKIEGSDSVIADAEVLGRWYADEGGFLDWARRWARGASEGAVGRGAQAVVEVVDTERSALDTSFSNALRAWVEAGRPDHRVVRIDQALKRLAARFLEQSADRRMLVLLLDGMAWAQAAELLQSLGARTVPWGPVTWHETASGRIGEGRYPVMFSALPSVTEVSRAAFFASKIPSSGTALSTAKDEERFRENKLLHPFCDEAAGPRLLLRAEGHTADGSASQEALSLIADSRRRIVGIVINAIDSSLKGDPQQHHDWTVDTIRSLPALLEAAADAGRTVMLASDHGHVPADRLRTLSSPAKAGARWRAWRSEDESLQGGELRFRGDGVYAPKGAEGVVLLTNDELRYGSSTHAGEHGGATLAEVVTPCVLIHWDEPGPDALLDQSLKVRPAYVPDWWHLTVRDATEIRRTVPPPSDGKGGKRANKNQLGLPGLAPPVPPPAIAAPTPDEEPLAVLADCEMLKARAARKDQRETVVKAVQFLLGRSGAAPDAVFAQHMGVLAFRVDGFISMLQEVLNVDGYDVLRFDPQHRQVFLDKAKLEQQFEVKL